MRVQAIYQSLFLVSSKKDVLSVFKERITSMIERHIVIILNSPLSIKDSVTLNEQQAINGPVGFPLTYPSTPTGKLFPMLKNVI